MQETSSSDQTLDPRVTEWLTRTDAPGDWDPEHVAELRGILLQLEQEAYFAESCAAEQFLRDTSRKSLLRGETPTSKYTMVLAETMKKVREARFPDLAKNLKKGSN